MPKQKAQEEPPEWRNPLTRRAGWDRYVYDPLPESPELPGLRTYLSASFDREGFNLQRDLVHTNWHIQETPAYTKFFGSADDRVRSNRLSIRQDKRSAAATGEPTAGKTTILIGYGKRHQRRAKPVEDQDERIVVVYVVVPGEPYGRGLPTAINRFMHHPLEHVKSGTNSQYMYKTLEAMTEHGVELLLIDEATNLWPTTTEGVKTTHTVRSLIEEFPGTVLFAGAGLEETGMFTGDHSKCLSGRVATIECVPYTRDTDEALAEWKGFLTALEDDIRLFHHTPNTLAKHEELIWERTEGLPASVAGLLTDACGRAIQGYLEDRKNFPKEQITDTLLESIPVNHFADTGPERRKRQAEQEAADRNNRKAQGVAAAMAGGRRRAAA